MLCDRMINRSEDSTRSCRFKLSVSDSDTLIGGLQSLFEHSSDSEQIRLLTIALTAWGRKKIVNFVNSTESQARAATELRQTGGTLAFPTSFPGNEPINPDTILSKDRNASYGCLNLLI
jgi:hypothetical protein